MLRDNILDVKLILLDDREFIGKLIFTDQQNIIEFNINPNGPLSPKTVPIVFCEARSRKFTLVHCVMFSSSLKSSSYIINELYEGEWIDRNNNEDYFSLEASVSYFNNWLKADVIELKPMNTKEYHFSVKTRRPKEFKIGYGENKTLIFTGNAQVKMERNEVRILKKSTVIINSKNSISRQELFQNYYSFLNLFTLFLRTLPKTSSLTFKRENSDLKLLFPAIEDKKESPFDVLINFDQITNLEIIISNYLKNETSYDHIIQLWEVCLNNDLDSVIIFLHLTQSIELFHEKFFQGNEKLRNQLENEIKNEFNDRPVQFNKKWVQMIRYYHLFQITEGIGLKVPFSNTKKEFIYYLLDSRNYYTHHSEKQFVWTNFELNSINNILRVWMRGLLLNQLELPIKVIQDSIKGDFYNSTDIDIFKNPHSMRFGMKK